MIVVLGARGFIGRALCARLAEEGVAVASAGRGDPLPDAPGAVCVHLAGSSDPADYLRPDAAEEAWALARTVLSAGYARVVFASTAHVYGDSSSAPRQESDFPDPRSPYATLKLALEGLFLPPHAVARLSNVYGPGQPSGNVFSDILRQLPGDGLVRLRGSGDSVRDYLYIDDAAEGLARLALSEECGVFNLSTGTGTSAADLARALARLRGRPDARVQAAVADAGSAVVLDPALAAARLDWRARVPLEEGLRRLLAAGGRR